MWKKHRPHFENSVEKASSTLKIVRKKHRPHIKISEEKTLHTTNFSKINVGGGTWKKMCKNVLTLLIFLTFEIFSFFFWKGFFFFFNLFYLQSNYSLKYVVQKVKTEPTSKTFTKCNFGLLDKVWINFPIKLSVKKTKTIQDVI